MNSEQVQGIIRSALIAAGSVLVTKGLIDQGTLVAMAGATVTLGAGVWGFWTRRNTGLITSAANVPNVTKIVTADHATADAVPSSKVVSQ
jgi:PII-like signaling protein